MFSRVPRMVVRDSRLVRNAMHNAFDFRGGVTAQYLDSQDAMFKQQTYLLSENQQVNMVSDASFSSQKEPVYDLGWQAWTEAYGQVATLEANDRQFTDANEKVAGVSLGMRRMFESGHSVAVAGHYLQSSLKAEGARRTSGKTDIINNSAGLSVGGRFVLPAYETGAMGAIVPSIEVIASYSALDIEQERYVFGKRVDSNTNGHLYQVGATAYATMNSGDTITVTPEAGVTYSFVEIDKFTENNKTTLGLKTAPEDYSSLLVHLGIRVDAGIKENVKGYVGASASYNVLDETVKLNNSFRSASAVRFQTVGEDNNSVNGYLQAGLNFSLGKDATLNAEYTFGVARDYQSHSVGLSMSIGF